MNEQLSMMGGAAAQPLPDSLPGTVYYRPTDQGLETRFRDRPEQSKAWKKQRETGE